MSQTSMSTVYVKHADSPDIDTRKLPLILCEAVNELTPTQVKGAQLFTGVWSIWLKSVDTKNYLLDGKFSLSIGNHRIFIYGEYPVIMRRQPTEKVIFKNVPFHVNDDDLLKYMYSLPDVNVQTKHIIPARLRNEKSELTPYLSGDRFLYIRGDFRRVLPSLITINNYKCRVLHHSQALACKRCRYLGHTANNTEACDAFCDEPNVITIRSQKNVLCNYYICDVNIYGHAFKSSEHAFQWKFCTHVKRDDLAQDVLNSPTPELAKEVTSMIPSHNHGTWHSVKCDIMDEILEAKAKSCPEFRQSLIISHGKRLVEAVRTDLFWSSGLIPLDASMTKPSYYPGLNRLGSILERLRSRLLLCHSTRVVTEKTEVAHNETTHSDTLAEGSDTLNTEALPSAHNSSLSQITEAIPSSSTSSIHPVTHQCSGETDVLSTPSTIQSVSPICSTESNVTLASSSTQSSSSSSVPVACPTVSLNMHSTPPLSSCDVPLVVSMSRPQHKETEPQIQLSSAAITKVQPRQTKKRQQKSSLKSHNQVRKETQSMVAQDNKGDLMSWIKRKLSPEKDADNTTLTKQLRSEEQKK